MFSSWIRQIVIVLFASCPFAFQAAETNTVPRPLSLSGCVRLALEHNLDVKIARFEPEIARHNVSLAYAAYEPTFEIAGTHNYSAAPGGIDGTSFGSVGCCAVSLGAARPIRNRTRPKNPKNKPPIRLARFIELICIFFSLQCFAFVHSTG